MNASDAVFSAGLREIASSADTGFVALAKLAGLDPRRDFRFADLSGTDLRGEDLRGFDLTGANLDGARIMGTRLPGTVTKRQLRNAVRFGRAMAVLVGERLLSDEREIVGKVGTEIYVPRALNEALRKSEADTHRRTRRTGAHIGDNGDLVRRRLNHALKVAPLPKQTATFVLAEPENDFDFDALLAVVSKLERTGQRPFVFLLPHIMSMEESGERIVRARLGSLDEANVINLMPLLERRGNAIKNPSRALDQALADRSMVLDFILSIATFAASGPAFQGRDRGMLGKPRPWLVRGTRKTRETLAAALARTTQPVVSNTFADRTRRVIMIREDLFAPESASRIAHPLQPRGGVCQVGTFKPVSGDNAEFYVVDAPPGSHLWGAFPRVA